MAIVSISRIQVRRGRENQDGVPQLAGGELAWAVDTQKLYIGNGAVSEGAPAVGNTELLSTKTNLFDLADQYVYNKDSSVVVTGDPAISRTLQERLDENVSVRSFGAQGDGSEQADKIQYAIDQLFANTDKNVPYFSSNTAVILSWSFSKFHPFWSKRSSISSITSSG